MDRRGFLGSMLAACAAPAIVRASSLMKCSGIIVPSQDLLLPATSMGGNSLLTIEMITAEMLAVLEKNLRFADSLNDHWGDEFKSIGRTLSIRRPQLEIAYG